MLLPQEVGVWTLHDNMDSDVGISETWNNPVKSGIMLESDLC